MLFLHYHKTPAHLNDGVTRVMLSSMPWAATLRCAFSCWVYSNRLVFPFSSNDEGAGSGVSQYNDFISENKDQGIAGVSLDSRLVEHNVLPLFLLFIIIVILKLVYKVFLILFSTL